MSGVDVTVLVGLLLRHLRHRRALADIDPDQLWHVTEHADRALRVLGVESQTPDPTDADRFYAHVAARPPVQPAIRSRTTQRHEHPSRRWTRREAYTP